MCTTTETRLRRHTPQLPSNSELHFAAENTWKQVRRSQGQARRAVDISAAAAQPSPNSERLQDAPPPLPWGLGTLWIHRNHNCLPSDRRVTSTHMFLLIFHIETTASDSAGPSPMRHSKGVPLTPPVATASGCQPPHGQQLLTLVCTHSQTQKPTSRVPSPSSARRRRRPRCRRRRRSGRCP